MKVLLVSNMYPGINPRSLHAGIFVKEQQQALEKLGVRFDTFIVKGYLSKFEYLKSIFTINWQVLTKPSYDVIHVHYGLTGLFLLVSGFWLRHKTVITFHGSDVSEKSPKYVQRWVSKRVARRAEKVIAVNETFRNDLEKLGVKAHVIPCGVDVEFFSRHENDANGRDINAPPFILFGSSPGRPGKNFALFKAVYDKLKETLPELEYKVLDGMGRIEVRSAMHRASLLLLTSTSEGSPQVVKEAMAASLPVVSVPVGDVKMLLDTLENYYVVDSYDVNCLYDATKSLLKITRNSSGSLERLQQLNLSSVQIAQCVLGVYEELCTRKRNFQR